MNISRLLYDIFRILLGVVFLSSGIGKFYGTSGLIGPGYMFEELAKYHLLFFAIFIAIAELVIGYLLLIKKYATLGAIMLFPMILNILVVVISLNWQGTPFVDGVFLLMNLYLLYYDRKKLYAILGLHHGHELVTFFKHTAIYNIGLLIIILGVLLSYFVDMKFEFLTGIGLVIFLMQYIYDWYARRRKN